MNGKLAYFLNIDSHTFSDAFNIVFFSQLLQLKLISLVFARRLTRESSKNLNRITSCWYKDCCSTS